MQKKIFTDQLGRTIQINYPPKIIISLVPSQTELLFDLGLNEEVVGVTKFCIHPKDKFKITTKIGGTKKLNIEKIRSLKPDLIIGNKEENEQQQIEMLMQEFPVWMSDIYNLNDALNMIKAVGDLVGKQEASILMAKEIASNFEAIQLGVSQKPIKKVAYFIWKDPYMLAGTQTFIHEMLKYGGLENVTNLNRYPIISESELHNLNPDVVLLSSEPYPFKDDHIKDFQKLWPAVTVKLVDGEMFSWYGSRLLKAAYYFKTLKF
ncbi:cobalamin-binding protein [Pedobacter cryophilus]|uniref:Cobalamin-binding protein n=2 Tax=Pedobacter cryophilus TaxID=2571271 RepID=A0A4U1C1X6_9SPHI|nr:cobalamin-binding protein [Pedobacter cryophilus]